MRDHQQQKDHKQPMRLNHQGSSREKDDPIESFMEEKITIQNNQHFGQDQLWLKKVKFKFPLKTSSKINSSFRFTKSISNILLERGEQSWKKFENFPELE